MNKLEEKVTVITGGGSGIGQGIALLLAQHGAKIVVADLDQSRADGTVQAITNQGGQALAIQADVSNYSSIQSLSQKVITEYGRIDILCNNAGIGHTGSILECMEDDWDRVMAVNAKGVYLGCHFFIPYMLKQGEGNIINMASVLGLCGVPKRAVYSASKGAIISLTRQLAIEYAGNNIRVNSISPGTVETPWIKRLLAENDDPEAIRQSLNARHPLGRLATVDEIAHAVLYLASPESAFVTGMNLVIDGGANAL